MSRAMESLIFWKKDGIIKVRTCTNGSTQQTYISKEQATGSTEPTASTKGVFITGVIEAKQHCYIRTVDMLNAFVQMSIDKYNEERIITKIQRSLVQILLYIRPTTYKEYITIDNNEHIIHIQMSKALYGMLVSVVLFYKKFRQDTKEIRFKISPNNVCIASLMIMRYQHSWTWHVDDI